MCSRLMAGHRNLEYSKRDIKRGFLQCSELTASGCSITLEFFCIFALVCDGDIFRSKEELSHESYEIYQTQTE